MGLYGGGAIAGRLVRLANNDSEIMFVISHMGGEQPVNRFAP